MLTIEKRDYKKAVTYLNNFYFFSLAVPNDFKSGNLQSKLDDTRVYANVLGLDIDGLSRKAVHVTGTKGKGSNCAMVESIIRNHGYSTGLLTSPHLVTVRERIRINGVPISEDLFSDYFWQCWDLLEVAQSEGKITEKPGWFRFLTIFTFYIFQKENVQSIVVEVGIGGRNDYTNILTKPRACGIALLDLDHQNVLGDTLEEIAYEKAGIMKKDVPVTTLMQKFEAIEVLKKESNIIGSKLTIVRPWSEYRNVSGIKDADISLPK